MNKTVVLAVALIFMACGAGCEYPETPQSVLSAERERYLNEVEQIHRETERTKSTRAKITLATPPGWKRSEPDALPPSDNGFTIAYEHDSGLSVTLYQFTRGHAFIPDELDSPVLLEEMHGAKIGIEQAVKAGYWQSAIEQRSGVVQLGDSSQQALWSRYLLKVDGMTLASDIFVWTRANTFFKLRCTQHSDDVSDSPSILRPLLTALGSPGMVAER